MAILRWRITHLKTNYSLCHGLACTGLQIPIGSLFKYLIHPFKINSSPKNWPNHRSKKSDFSKLRRKHNGRNRIPDSLLPINLKCFRYTATTALSEVNNRWKNQNFYPLDLPVSVLFSRGYLTLTKLSILLLMTVFTQSFFPFVRRNFITFTLLSTRHKQLFFKCYIIFLIILQLAVAK